MDKKKIFGRLVKKTSAGILKGTKYHYKKALNKPQDLTFLVYAVTQRCNSRCIMCNIWQKETGRELTIQELNSILKDPFFASLRYVNLTGGEPFLRKDLAEIAGIFGELNNFSAIQIPTNGLLTNRIIETVENILQRLPPTVYLSISVSIDGDKAKHDQIRGIKGIYDNAIKTLQHMQSIKDSRLIVGVEATVSQANIHSIDEVYHHLKNLSDHVGFYPVISSNSFYGNEANKAVKKDSRYIQKAVRFFSLLRENEPEHAFYYDRMVSFLLNGSRSFKCLAGQKTAYLSSGGVLFPCLMLSDREEYFFGNLLDGKAMEAWRGVKGRLIRKKLINNPICSQCSLSCDLINNLNEEFFEIIFFYIKNLRTSVKLLRDIKQNKIKVKNIS